MKQLTLDEIKSTAVHQCPECDSTFDNEDSLTIHFGRTHGESIDQYRYRVYGDGEKCPTCGEILDNKGAMRSHHTQAHGESLIVNEYNCEMCGEQFQERGDRERKYCSNECLYESFRQRESKNNIECRNCGNVFEVIDSRKGDAKYCSKECYHEGAHYGFVTLECSQCGTNFDRRKWEYERRDTTNPYCSIECMLKQKRSGVRIGDRNTIYRAVRDGLLREGWDRYSQDHRGPQCVLCGSESDLQLHHIIPLMSGGVHGEWNEMTLCNSCHHGKVEPYTRFITEPHLLKDINGTANI